MVRQRERERESEREKKQAMCRITKVCLAITTFASLSIMTVARNGRKKKPNRRVMTVAALKKIRESKKKKYVLYCGCVSVRKHWKRRKPVFSSLASFSLSRGMGTLGNNIASKTEAKKMKERTFMGERGSKGSHGAWKGAGRRG